MCVIGVLLGPGRGGPVGKESPCLCAHPASFSTLVHGVPNRLPSRPPASEGAVGFRVTGLEPETNNAE